MNALIIICGLGFMSLLAEITNLKRGLHTAIIIGLVLAAVLLVMDWNSSIHYYSDMLVFDNFSIVFAALILVVAVFWFCISETYFLKQPHQTDRSALVVFTIAGGIMMVSFHNMAMLFLGIEILSISLYVLAGSNKESFFSNEAAFKYFLMGSFATGFLLMGIALIYGATGSFDIAKISFFIEAHKTNLPVFFYSGLFLMFIGIAFKISVVPFHFWAPDVYGGSPTLITALMSTVVKIAAVGAFYKIFSGCFLSVQASIISTTQVIIVLTLLVANITAVYQKNVKRILAYSSIAHVGYILLGFISESVTFGGTLFYYLTSYSIASLIAFSILHGIENRTGGAALENFNGLYKKSAFGAITLTVSLLSMAGIPPLTGFFAKYFILARAVKSDYIGLVILAVITSLIGVFYYFKIIIVMFSKDPDDIQVEFSPLTTFIVIVLTLLTLILGIFPDWMIRILG
ncbi:MAG TPA: NADH-quinone oxidoreductase subunit N [Chitinophagaceae bacterium]|nr:NADH-quinone oxidoreductase subunit N [Chitinophagaceae bacterium]